MRSGKSQGPRYWGTGCCRSVRAAVGEPAEAIAVIISLAKETGIDHELSWEEAIALLPEFDRLLGERLASHPEEFLALCKQYLRLHEP